MNNFKPMQNSTLAPLRLLCFIAVGMAIMGIMNQIFFNVSNLEQIDLRNRIVASRLIETEHSPYHYKWSPGDDERYLDRRIYTTEFSEFPVSFTTLPPSTLILQQPLSRFGYLTIKKVWMWIQFIMLAGIIILLARKTDNEKAALWIITGGCIYSISYIWDLHLSVGQLYVIYPALLVPAYLGVAAKRRLFQFAGGFIIGLSILFRPSFALLLLPILLNRRYRVITGSMSGIIAGVLIFVVPHLSLWTQYFDAMKFWSRFNFMTDSVKWDVAPPSWLPGHFEGFFPSGERSFGLIENASFQYQAFRYLNIELSTLHLAGLMFLLVTGVLYFLRKVLFNMSTEHIFLLGAGLMIVSDYFLPAPRIPYNAIQWVFPVLLLFKISEVKFDYINVLVFSGLNLSLYSFRWLNLNIWFAEILIFAGILLFIRNAYNTRHANPERATLFTVKQGRE
jgi:hypothetical protein